MGPMIAVVRRHQHIVEVEHNKERQRADQEIQHEKQACKVIRFFVKHCLHRLPGENRAMLFFLSPTRHHRAQSGVYESVRSPRFSSNSFPGTFESRDVRA